MKRLAGYIRRHPRLWAGGAVVLLAGVGLLTLRSAGPAHGAAGAAHAATSSSRSASAQSPRSPRPARIAFATATVRSATARRPARHGGAAGRPGIPAATPNTTELAQALRRATGLSPAQVTTQSACPPAAKGHARCAAEVLVLRSNHALVRPRGGVPASGGLAKPATGGSSTQPQLFTPQYLQQAYDVSYLSQTAGKGDTVAIVDVGDDATAASDLATYRQAEGLPACNGCFQKVNQTGGTSWYPPAAGWHVEESLDIEAVSAICPNCHILLVEASSTDLSDLHTAMVTAHKMGANQISDSWTDLLSSPPTGTFTWSGTATVAATGDAGYVGAGQDNYPAALPGVTAAGGTTLSPAGGLPNLRGFGEGAWSGAGSGCDLGEPKASGQTDTGCPGRSYADVSADADPLTGLNVYDSSYGGWVHVGGTSLATPLIAAYYAITGVEGSSPQVAGPQWAYADSGLLNDITSGSNGGCAAAISYICNAASGYDGPTGVGSISGDVVAGAPGIGAPSVPTAGANTYTASVRSDGATITGGIYPNGLATRWWINYWPANSSTVQQTPAADIGSGTAAVAVTGYPSHLASNTTYDYQLLAKNADGTVSGYTSSFTTSSASAPPPTAAFTPSPTTSTPNATVNFNASASTPATGDTIASYSWDFGDPSSTNDTATGPSPAHSYANPGQYNVTLIVTDSNGQTESTTQAVTVDAPPTASFTAPSRSPGSSVSFDASGSSDSVGNIQRYSWKVVAVNASSAPNNSGNAAEANNTNETATESTPTYTVPVLLPRGTYQVTLSVTNDALQTNTTVQTVTVDDPPTATTTLPNVTTPNSTVSFTATATSPDAALGGSIAGYSWNFGDGTTDANANTSHVYANPGTYPVSLTVTDDLGQSYTTPTQIVTVDATPGAAFTVSSGQPAPPGQVSFNAGGSSDSFGTIKSYSWSFAGPAGPNSTVTSSADPNPTQPLTRGTYTVSLTVTNDAGQVSPSTNQTVTVDDAPTATLAPSTTLTTPGAPVSFAAAATPDAGGSIASHEWSFGDGSTSTESAPSHPYTAPGTYAVSLTVTDDLGVRSAPVSSTITVDATPTAAFTATSNPVTAGSAVGFNAGGSSDSVGTITGYSWDFGDGATATGQAPSHVYASPGTYPVSLTVTNDAGQTAGRAATVTVNGVPSPAPTPAASPTPSPAPAPVAPQPLTAGVAGAKKLKLAAALAHGLRVSVAVSQDVTASFQVTVPVLESTLAGSHKTRTSSIVFLHTRAQVLGAGSHAITLKLSRAAAHELAGAGPLILTVRVTLTDANGAKVSRSVKIALTR